MRFRGYQVRIVDNRGAVKRVAALVVLEGGGELPGILERLAEGELDIDAFLATSRTGGELSAHRVQIGRLETEGLEVREARVGTAAPRLHADRPSKHLDRAAVQPELAQQVSVGEPCLRLMRVGGHRPLH